VISDRSGALGTIGNTPIVPLSRLAVRNDAEMWVKLETAEHRGDLYLAS
jgi:hypothetical protein